MSSAFKASWPELRMTAAVSVVGFSGLLLCMDSYICKTHQSWIECGDDSALLIREIMQQTDLLYLVLVYWVYQSTIHAIVDRKTHEIESKSRKSVHGGRKMAIYHQTNDFMNENSERYTCIRRHTRRQAQPTQNIYVYQNLTHNNHHDVVISSFLVRTFSVRVCVCCVSV